MPKGQKRAKKAKVSKATKTEIKKEVIKVIKQAEETHYKQEYANGTTVDTTHTLINLTDTITQGDTELTRTGDEIKLTSFQMRYNIYRNIASTTSTWCGVRLVLLKWYPDDSADAPYATDIMYDTTNSPYLSQFKQNKALSKKFKVLWDKQLVLGSPTSANMATSYNGTLFVPSKKLGRILFNQGATTGKGHIYLLTYSTGSGTDDAKLSYQTITRFAP